MIIKTEDSAEQPFVSFCIFSYNQELYIGDAIKGALSQTYESMEIIISDDCSTDGTWEIIKKTVDEYRGSKKVVVNRNNVNLNLVPHTNYVIKNIAKGEIIVFAGGDDISLPNRVQDTVDEFVLHPQATAVCGQAITIDKYGNRIGDAIQEIRPRKVWVLDNEYIRSLSFMAGIAGLSIKKSVFEQYGELLPETPTEDSTYRFRSIMSGEVIESEKVFLYYRRHDSNLTHEIYKLKTNKISRQYRVDIEKAFALDIIDKKVRKRLLNKVRIYNINRNLAARKEGLPRPLKMPFKVLQMINVKLLQWV